MVQAQGVGQVQNLELDSRTDTTVTLTWNPVDEVDFYRVYRMEGTYIPDECFIATAAYGSRYQPPVMLLREFRDRFLLTNQPGQSLVQLYYQQSPPLAAYIAGSEVLKGVTRLLLTPVVMVAYAALNLPVLALLLIALMLVAGLTFNRVSSRPKATVTTALLLIILLIIPGFSGAQGNGTFQVVGEVPGEQDTVYTDEGLQPETVYSYRVTAVVGAAEGKASNVVRVTTGAPDRKVTGVTLNRSTLDLEVGRTSQLTATVSPADATNKGVTWSSDNTPVATVSNGTVTGVSEGTATITVTTVDGEFTATCTVNVNMPDPDPGRIFDVSGEVSAQVETPAGTYSQALVSYTLDRDGGVAISLYDAGGNIITERSGLIREAGNPYVEVFALTRLASSYSISVDGTLEIDKGSFLSGDQPGPYYFGILDALVPADSAARVIKPDNGEIATGEYDITKAFANWTNQPPGKPLIINDTTGEPVPAIAHLRVDTVLRTYGLHPDEDNFDMVIFTGTDDYYELAGDVVIISYDLSVSPAVRKVETTDYFDDMTGAENADLLLGPIDGKVKLVQVYKE